MNSIQAAVALAVTGVFMLGFMISTMSGPPTMKEQPVVFTLLWISVACMLPLFFKLWSIAILG